MDKKQRIGMQRALMREAFGKMRAAEELFGIEDKQIGDSDDDFSIFSGRLDEFETWAFCESPIA